MNMGKRAVVVLGRDAPAIALAGRLARSGHDVVLWEPPSGAEPSVRSASPPLVRMHGASGEATVPLALVTDDAFAALGAGDVLTSCLLAQDEETFVRLVLPLVEPRHTVVLLEGCLSSLNVAKWLRDHGRGVSGLPTLVESDVLPVVATLREARDVDVAAVVPAPGLGVFPAHRTTETLDLLGSVLPGARAHPHVLAAALAAVVPFLRVATALMNVGPLERVDGTFAVFAHGFSPGVARLLEVLDAERLALATALGLDLPTAAEALDEWGLGPRGDLWAAVNGSRALTRCHTRVAGPETGRRAVLYLSGAACLGTWGALADLVRVSMPALRAVVTLSDAVTGTAGVGAGRPLDDLGLAGLSEDDEVMRLLHTGSAEQDR